MENRNCIKCEEEFVPYNGNQKQCTTCKEKEDNRSHPIKTCIKCEEEFVLQRSTQKYCVTCIEKGGKRYESSRPIKTCKGCGEDFKESACNQAYCSLQCREENRSLLTKYKITRKDWNIMYEAQGGVCAICSGEGVSMKGSGDAKYTLCVDHCHQTGKIRGLLCSSCNKGLGFFQDNTHTISKAISYLEGATTIEKSSTPKQVEAQSRGRRLPDDIV